jgi:hypothetical protein
LSYHIIPFVHAADHPALIIFAVHFFLGVATATCFTSIGFSGFFHDSVGVVFATRTVSTTGLGSSSIHFLIASCSDIVKKSSSHSRSIVLLSDILLSDLMSSSFNAYCFANSATDVFVSIATTIPGRSLIVSLLIDIHSLFTIVPFERTCASFPKELTLLIFAIVVPTSVAIDSIVSQGLITYVIFPHIFVSSIITLSNLTDTLSSLSDSFVSTKLAFTGACSKVTWNLSA